MMININWIDLCKECVREASEAIMEVYSGRIDVEEKGDGSPLTLADKRAHDIIFGALSATDLPVLSEEGKHISYSERKKWEKYWMVDPLDGTKEFVSRNGEFGINIALIENAKASLGFVASPVKKTLWWASTEEGVLHEEALFPGQPLISLDIDPTDDAVRILTSRSHLDEKTEKVISLLSEKYNVISSPLGSSLKFPALAQCKADLYLRFGPTMEWDTASGQAILEAAGGQMLIYSKGFPSLQYSKAELVNPAFLCFAPDLEKDVRNKVIQLLSS